MQRINSKTPKWRQECPFHLETNKVIFHAKNKLKNAEVTARMSISLRNEQGFYFMYRINSKTPKWRQECPFHLETNEVFISGNG